MGGEFKWRHFAGEVILLCVRWYCRYGISYRDLEEMLKQGSEDTDFKFVNPTNLDLRLEYAFFSADGTKLCGCDADDFAPNKTVEYTMADEIAGNLFLPGNCPGSNFGAMKAIAFRPSSNEGVDKNALQVGFQERLLGQQKVISAESGLKAIPFTQDTQAEIAHIYQLCKGFGAPQ